MDANSKLRILVLGYIVRRPLGGGTWPTLQWTLGLRDLGHDVYFFEDSDDYPACYDPSRHVTDEDPSFGLAYARRVFDAVDLGERWAYYDAHRKRWHGPCGSRATELAASADLLVNNSGIHPIRPWLEHVPLRAYIDTDPGFEQIRLLTDEWRQTRAGAHNLFFTLGENIPGGDAVVPDTPYAWRAMRQPVVLDQWPVTPGDRTARLTTVMNWDSYASREWNGIHFGMKSESFTPYVNLPESSRERFELAIGGAGAPKAELRARGWSIIDPLVPTRDPWTYQDYLRASKAEFTVAKSGYVRSRCGWFSERSAHYLASGRPVVTEDTGFGSWLDAEKGVLSFKTPCEALQRLEELDRDYDEHCAAAREVAERYFDSKSVLRRFLRLAYESRG